jgi:LysR family nitrogen assimilation transcriptional regulator
LDMTICYDPHVDDPSRITPLYRERLFLIGPPDMLQEFNETVPFSQLGQFPLILDDRFQVLRQLIESTARTQGISLQVTLEIEPVNLKREMIVHHRRCTILPYGLFRDEIESGQLAAVPIEAPVLERTLHIASRPGLLLSIERFMLSRIRPLVRQKIADGQVGWQEP